MAAVGQWSGLTVGDADHLAGTALMGQEVEDIRRNNFCGILCHNRKNVFRS
jgi:hypothetical protein